MADRDETAVQRGITALRGFLGQDVARDWLEPITPRHGEAAAFSLPLPVDFTGIARRLRIGFPNNFPRGPLALHVRPSPWLQWPHAMRDGVCLHGFRERPITGTPESVVVDSLQRLRQILAFSVEGSDPTKRADEFQAEITSYWSHQLPASTQNVLLLNSPASAGPLFALSDPRPMLVARKQTLWLSNDMDVLRKHHRRVVDLDRVVRAPATPGFYVKLLSYPPIEVPQAEALFEWLTPHLADDDVRVLVDWLDVSDALPARWVVVELPGTPAGPLYCFHLRSKALQPHHGQRFGLRAARRDSVHAPSLMPPVLQAATLDLLERSAVHSRDLSGTAASLESRKVVLVGVGSLGSPVAVQLARAGVGHLTLIDPDTLVSENLGRHVLGMDELGKYKSTALRTRLLRELPGVQIEAYRSHAEAVLAGKPDVFDHADLVIVTTADWGSEAALWRAKAEGADWPLLQAWSEPNAVVGHALMATQPKADARGLFDERGEFRRPYTQWPNGGVVPLPACGESFVPGGALGMANVVGMVVQAAQRVLRGQAPATAWLTSISAPDEVSRLGGHYSGPELQDGYLQAVLERSWPVVGTDA